MHGDFQLFLNLLSNLLHRQERLTKRRQELEKLEESMETVRNVDKPMVHKRTSIQDRNSTVELHYNSVKTGKINGFHFPLEQRPNLLHGTKLGIHKKIHRRQNSPKESGAVQDSRQKPKTRRGKLQVKENKQRGQEKGKNDRQRA